SRAVPPAWDGSPEPSRQRGTALQSRPAGVGRLSRAVPPAWDGSPEASPPRGDGPPKPPPRRGPPLSTPPPPLGRVSPPPPPRPAYRSRCHPCGLDRLPPPAPRRRRPAPGARPSAALLPGGANGRRRPGRTRHQDRLWSLPDRLGAARAAQGGGDERGGGHPR